MNDKILKLKNQTMVDNATGEEHRDVRRPYAATIPL